MQKPQGTHTPLFNKAARRRLKQANLELYRDITDDVEESDFVPYACFYDHNTIITKNGELCQTIKVTGLARETIGSGHDERELRELIRESLKRHVPNDSFAIWLHTIRKDTSVIPEGEFKEQGFAYKLNNAWIEHNQFSHQYVNEVFITIVHEGQSARILNAKNFMRGLLPAKDLKWRNEHIDRIYTVLDTTVEKILEDLKGYGANRLTIFKENGIYYSEQLRFLEKIINFVDRPMPVVEMDLSTYLTSGEITFAFNAMEVRTASGKRRFATILTLKEYKEASLGVIDQFLQLPMEFIVTQCVNFVNPQKVLFEYQELYNYQRLSEDPDISKMSELTNIIDSNRNNPNDFGEQQLTIFILADSTKQLEENIRRTIAYFAHFGMVVIREDIKFEETYWAQLPGNFVFVSRMKATNTSHVAGFANLNNMPVGKAKNNHWGPATTTFHTASGTPYYFNFHEGNIGHTCLVGNAGSGKTVLLHFLLAQSMKFNPDIFYFDITGKGALLIKELGGRVLPIGPVHSDIASSATPLFNPFALSTHQANIEFIAKWMGVLARTMGYNPTAEEKQAITDAVNQTFAQGNPNQRNLGFCVSLLKDKAPSYVHSISPWLEGGKFGHIYTASGEGAIAGQKLVSFQLSQVVSDVALQATVISLLLQILTDKLRGNPTIIVMQEAWQLIMQTHVAATLEGWMGFIARKNTMLLSTLEQIEQSASSEVSQIIARQSVTEIFMPDDDPTEQYKNLFNLSELEFSYLELMDPEQRHFLVKHRSETIVGEMNLAGLEEFIPILAGKATRTR